MDSLKHSNRLRKRRWHRVSPTLGQTQSELAEKKVYLQKDLKLASLAELIGLSGHQLSYLINQEFAVSYSDLINEYRIEAAKRLLQDPEIRKEKLLRIAYDVGFSNKTSFFNAFKKHTGVTPSEWRNEQERVLE